MPTYEFRCPAGHDFEKFYRSIGAAPSEVRCPTCGKVAGRQLSAGGGLLFKGSGFYITDYGKDGKKSQAPVKAAGDDAATKASGESAGSKPESSKLESSKSESSKSESSGGTDTGASSGSGAATGESKAPTESKPAAPAPAQRPKTSE